MKVIKRNGSEEIVKFDKISARLKKQTYGLDANYVDYMEVAKKVISGVYDGVTSRELDTLAAETAASLTRIHPDYSILAARIALTSIKKETKKSFRETVEELYKNVDPKTKEHAPLVSRELVEISQKFEDKIEQMIIHDRDFDFEYFGFKVLEKSYLLKMNGRVFETPQHLYMRVAIGIWGDNLKEVQKTYELLSTGMFTHATPTLFNAGTQKPQLSSCFLIANKGDDIESLFDTLKETAIISKWSGGVGLHVHDVRSKGSYIKGTGGESDGLVPMLKTYNETARWINQGGKRKGSFAIYLEPWHADVEDFIPLRKNHGKEEERARDLFLALWTPDLFMLRVQNDENWTLMCPNECPGLSDVYDVYPEYDNDGNLINESEINLAFTDLYTKYENEGRGKKVVKARELWSKILDAQIETGTPYILYKDSANKKSNQKNIGVIKSSNLCITGDQRVVTDKGYLTAKELYESGKELNLFNGEQVVKSSKMNLIASNEKVFKITLENGMEHKVTEYHGLPILDAFNNITRVECKDLKIGDKIAIQTKKGLFGVNDMVDEAYLLGIYQSDGTQNKSSILFDIWENDFDLIEDIEQKIKKLNKKYNHKPRYLNQGGKFLECKTSFSKVRKKRLSTTLFKEKLKFEKGYVPEWIWSSNEETQWAYVKGLLQADGTVFKSKSKGNPIQISYSEININFLKDLQLIFNNLGLQSSIRLLRKGGKRILPNGKGGNAIYDTKDCFRLIVGNKNDALVLEEKTSFLSRKGIIVENKIYRDNTKKSYKILSIEPLGREDVYCPTVYNDEHIFVAQGFKTFNCTEILEVSTPTETAVCNLASIALPKMIDYPTGKIKKDKNSRKFNFQKLYEVTYQAAVNLDRVIDVNWYPTDNTERSNMRHRPIGLGVQGLADTFALLGMSFESEDAKKLNKDIFETMYFAAITASNDIAKKIYKENSSKDEEVSTTIGAYSTFEGSPASKGILQFDMWNLKESDLSGIWDWSKLKKSIVKYGIRNSLSLAPMPTASTAAILGNNECFEPFTTNLYKRNVLSGEFIIVNRYLVEDLIDLNLWTDEIRIKMIQNNGSIQTISEIPEKLKEVYKTVWEMKASNLIDMAADRGAFICQSQSMNLFIRDANVAKLNKALFYGWNKGLKTGMYYLRSNAKAEARKSLGENINTVKETIEVIEDVKIPENKKNIVETKIDLSQQEIDAMNQLTCSIDNPEGCEACGS